jgi:hypothetical protein
MSNIIQSVSDGSTFGPGQKVVIGPFVHTNLATTPLANGACPLGGVLSNPATGAADWVAPFGGRIIAGSVQLGTAFLTTTGTLKYLIAVNGTTQASATKLVIQPSIGAGNLTKTVVAGNVDGTTAITFTRGQRIGIRMTSASTVNPATVEGYVTLVVEI